MTDNIKLPPNDNDSEESVIGSLLIDGSAIIHVVDLLKPDNFYFEINGNLYGACLELYKRGDAINQVTLAQELNRTNKLESCGGVAKLSYLISICPTSLDIEHYAKIVHRLSVMRQLIGAGDRIASLGYAVGEDEEVSLSKAESYLFSIRGDGKRSGLIPIRQSLDEFFETPVVVDGEVPQLHSVNSGYHVLDEFLMGFQRSDLIIVAGRPSMGKTSLALNIARNAAIEQRACVAIFSLEMSRNTLVLRLLSSESGVNSRDIKLGQSEIDERAIMEACGVLAEAPIYVDDTPMLRMTNIRSNVLRLNFERNVDMVVVDYLQLIQGEGMKEGNRVQEISYISRALKALAREINAPVIAVSQLSRAVEGRASHEPQLSDLRESGSIEQDADVVLFIYRDEYYYKTEEEWIMAHPDREYPHEEADLIIAKHRNGATGRVKLRFRHKLAKFDNMAIRQTVRDAKPEDLLDAVGRLKKNDE